MSIPDGAPSSGRRLNGTIASTTGANVVTTSASQKVNTVSRCIADRVRGRLAAITCSAAPALNRARATWVTAWCEVRSPMPISHDALADRHHVAALEGGEPVVGRRPSRSPSHTSYDASAKAGWNR